MVVKKIVGKMHLWLGLACGPVVLFLGLTGCILAFQREIESVSKPYQYVTPMAAPMLPPSRMQQIAERALPGKKAHSVTYGLHGKAVVATFYHDKPKYYYLVYLNPYTGQVLKVKDMDRDFFRVVVDGHFYLWLPPEIGKPIVASATLVFVVMMISGMVLWWPRNKAARKQRFSVKWNAKWRRRNYDLHNVLGFYMSWVAIFIAITGLVWGFQWVGNLVYLVASGGESPKMYKEALSKPIAGFVADNDPAVDKLWRTMTVEYVGAQTLEVHYPQSDSASIEIAANPEASTYWKTDYRFFDQYTLDEIPVAHAYGRLDRATGADKVARMNYDIHVGAVLGLPGKIMAFFASLIAASLPVTGFLIWRGRRTKPGKPTA